MRLELGVIHIRDIRFGDTTSLRDGVLSIHRAELQALIREDRRLGEVEIELALAKTAQRCEQLGIRTAIAMLHMGADIKDVKYGALTIFNMEEVDAIVSMGFPFPEVVLPAVDRVIGRPGAAPEGPIEGEHLRAIRWIKGSQCQLGSSRLRAVRH